VMDGQGGVGLRRDDIQGRRRYWPVGPPGQRGGKGRDVPFRDDALLGLGPNLGLGRIGSPGLFSFLYFFISFSFSFLIFWFVLNSFTNLVQTNSNKFLGPSNIHCSVLNHSETCFQNKIWFWVNHYI
jgi:hypothetical protein